MGRTFAVSALITLVGLVVLAVACSDKMVQTIALYGSVPLYVAALVLALFVVVRLRDWILVALARYALRALKGDARAAILRGSPGYFHDESGRAWRVTSAPDVPREP